MIRREAPFSIDDDGAGGCEAETAASGPAGVPGGPTGVILFAIDEVEVVEAERESFTVEPSEIEMS